jgi:hypothetical protein
MGSFQIGDKFRMRAVSKTLGKRIVKESRMILRDILGQSDKEFFLKEITLNEEDIEKKHNKHHRIKMQNCMWMR